VHSVLGRDGEQLKALQAQDLHKVAVQARHTIGLRDQGAAGEGSEGAQGSDTHQDGNVFVQQGREGRQKVWLLLKQMRGTGLQEGVQGVLVSCII